MRVLHICNDFSYSKVYKNLYEQLDSLDIQQIVYHPLRHVENIGKNVFPFKVVESEVVYSKVFIKWYHRFLFRRKVNLLYKDLLSSVDVSKIDISYPTTLFSDGAIAYKLFKKFKLPYIVAVRNTDVNLFLAYRPDLIPFGLKILESAEKIVFISEGLKVKFFEHPYFIKYKETLSSKTQVIANGIDSYWLSNNIRKFEPECEGNNFLFIGRFDKNKNVLNLIKALDNLRNKYRNIHLDLVGGGGDLHDEVCASIKNNSWCHFYGKVYEKDELKMIFHKNDFFAMPSIYETFGLVYIEALSQGLPVLYTKNQGIDKLFSFEVGEGADGTITDIQLCLEKMILNRKSYKINDIVFNRFNWMKIAELYKKIFLEGIK
ncbi:glycosyltransferase family 4 protein [Sphingobacterium sp. SG20118]|uniref:glycosyltransferase family 4 protein n=1 Tax=Sphingobacterium sp. SG20118 TaxID=3367156 RepID=UPI0037DFC11C